MVLKDYDFMAKFAQQLRYNEQALVYSGLSAGTRYFPAEGQNPMKYFLRAFTPTKNRRLNELVGFLLFVSATLLFLALASYSPLDPSLNTAGSLNSGGSGSAHNWIGLFGAMLSDLLLQSIGVFVFAAPVMLALLGARWFTS